MFLPHTCKNSFSNFWLKNINQNFLKKNSTNSKYLHIFHLARGIHFYSFIWNYSDWSGCVYTFFNYFLVDIYLILWGLLSRAAIIWEWGCGLFVFLIMSFTVLCCHYNSIIYSTLDVKSHWVWGAVVQFRNVHGMGAGNGLAQWAECLPSKREAPGFHPQRYTNWV